MHYYLGLRKRPSTHRTLGPRGNVAVDLNTPVLMFRDQACPGLSCDVPAHDAIDSQLTHEQEGVAREVRQQCHG